MTELGAPKRSGGRSKMVSVRFEPRLRYLADLAARKQRRTLSSFIDWAVEQALVSVEIGPEGETIADLADQLWDAQEPDRFLKLAFHFEELLNHEEQLVWKLIQQNSYFQRWEEIDKGHGLSYLGIHRPAHPEDGEGEWVPDEKKVREHWATLVAVARGQEPPSALPSVARQVSSLPELKAKKRHPRRS